jgi:UDP-glucuronate 4-epimerase
MNFLITGCAGFIGFHLTARMLEDGHNIFGIDSMDNYYDVDLKKHRLLLLQNLRRNFSFENTDLAELETIRGVFQRNNFDYVIHLAAQPGIRHYLKNPFAYQKSNLQAFYNVIELTKQFDIRKFIFASSSSVYGNNTKIPFSESDNVDHPASLYAATKKANELIAHTYYHNFGMNVIGLRLFTVYGKYGRPDMAYYKFAESVAEGKPIEVYNFGKMKRDFTHVSDIINGISSLIALLRNKDLGYEIFNLGNSHAVELEYFISLLEKELGKKADKKYLPKPSGEMDVTYADISKAKEILGFEPRIRIEEGLKEFVQWYKEYHGE